MRIDRRAMPHKQEGGKTIPIPTINPAWACASPHTRTARTSAHASATATITPKSCKAGAKGSVPSKKRRNSCAPARLCKSLPVVMIHDI